MGSSNRAETQGERYFLVGTSDTYPTAAVGGSTTTQGNSDLGANDEVVIDRIVVRSSAAAGGVITIKDHDGNSKFTRTFIGLGVGLGKNPYPCPVRQSFRGGLRAVSSTGTLEAYVHFRVLDRGDD